MNKMTWLLHPLRSYRYWRTCRVMRRAAEIALPLLPEALQAFSLQTARNATFTEESVIESLLISVVADNDGDGPGFTIDADPPAIRFFDSRIFTRAVLAGASRIGRIY